MREGVISFYRLSLLLTLSLLLVACSSTPTDVTVTNQLPAIYPDYIGVTIPDGIAPMNFNIRSNDEVEAVDVVVKGSKGGELHTNDTWARFGVDEWHALTTANKGGDLTFTVCVKQGGKWTQYKDFKMYVSKYDLEEWGLTYRRIAPGYEVFSHMGIYQRDLANFEESAIIDNTQLLGQCINCHMTNRTNPDRMVFHIRGDHGATLMQMDGQRDVLAAKNDLLGGSMVYPYWHPSGDYCAFSTNQTRQGFHEIRDERIEVFDLSSDIFVYNPKTREILEDSLISTKEWSENSPVFSPDGKTIYYMTCKQVEDPNDYKNEKYNLCRIAFDPATGKYGNKVDTLFNAVKMGKSLTWPRPSYDGKWMLFTLIDYGYFSIWHRESDQWLMNLQTGESRPFTEINSDNTDSYHNWNVNSHWIVFTSRRGDGLHTRLYLASIDENGKGTKPFLLPQENPWEYYDESLYSFNTPDFSSKKVEFDSHSAAREIMSDKRNKTKVRQ